MRKRTLVTLIIILIIIAFSIYALNKNGGNQDEQLAKCIASKSTLYIKTGCFACIQQEKLFGETYKYLNIVDYVIDPQKCLDAGITHTPTWIINGQKITGAQSLETLKELTGC